DLSLKADFDYYISGHQTTRFGFQYTRYDAMYRQGFGETTRSEINTVSAYETGYLQHTWATGAFEFIPGIRASHFHSGNYTNLSPRASARYYLTESLALKAGWGMYYQYLNLISVEGFSYTTDMWLPVDETLEPGRAYHTAGGLTLSDSEGWNLDLEFYHKTMSNLVEFQSRVRLDDSTPLSDLFLQGTGKAYGGEVLLRKTAGRTTGWIGYTLGWTRQTFPDINNGLEFPPKYDRRHDISVVSNLDVGRGWNTNLTWVFGTGQAYTIPESRYEVTQPSGQTIPYVHVAGKNSYRLPAYHRMDVGLTKAFRVGETTAELMLSVFNVYNRRNIWYRSFDASEDEILFQDVLLQPILPSIGIKFRM
ncbi:MAG: TonB-dependent receptor, partial [Candidatus Latescibacteria bacterium]|nr:TonB-dependent receptor [Candidatus Latescibacterota bacterium]